MKTLVQLESFLRLTYKIAGSLVAKHIYLIIPIEFFP